jgi:hypothetical protein
MTRFCFMLRLEQPPVDEQVRRLFLRASDLCVEVGAWRGWSAVVVERAAPTLAEAIVTAVRDVESVGLVPVDTGPDCDLVPIWLIGKRAGCSARAVRRWASGESGPGGFPSPVGIVGRPAYYRWGDVRLWLRRRLGLRLPDDESAYAAANLVLRLRAIAPRVEGAATMWSLL